MPRRPEILLQVVVEFLRLVLQTRGDIGMLLNAVKPFTHIGADIV